MNFKTENIDMTGTTKHMAEILANGVYINTVISINSERTVRVLAVEIPPRINYTDSNPYKLILAGSTSEGWGHDAKYTQSPKFPLTKGAENLICAWRKLAEQTLKEFNETM